MIGNEHLSEARFDPVVSLCEDAAAGMRAVIVLTQPGSGSRALEHPGETHRALFALELFLDRSAQALSQIARGFKSQVDSGFVAMDVGTPYSDDLQRAAQDLERLLVDEAAPALGAAATAVERALALLAPATLVRDWCA